jgi:hypothetical protein
MASNTIVSTAPAIRASDEEILGLAPNTIRKSGRAALAKNAGEKTSAGSSHAEVDEFFADLDAAGKQQDDRSGDAQAATKLLGDLSRTDALFFSRRPDEQFQYMKKRQA